MMKRVFDILFSFFLVIMDIEFECWVVLVLLEKRDRVSEGYI